MTSRERVRGSLGRTGYDRIPVKHEGTPEVNQMLMKHLGLTNGEQLKCALGDDFRYVEAVYRGPELREFPDGSMQGYWGERYQLSEYDGGSYLEASHMPFADITSLDDLDRSNFPSADWWDFSTIKQQCEARKGQYAICFGGAGDLDFINGISRCRGVEQVLMDLALGDPIYLEIMQARFEYYYQIHERALQAAGGEIDIVHCGEDLGTQRGPLISMATFDTYFAPKLEAFYALAHRYGAKTMMHMCGCIEKFLPRLIELGLDIADVVQPTTPSMQIDALAEQYGDKINFCGSMCVQSVLPYGTPENIETEVQYRRRIFAQGGLFLGPTHAIQPGTPLENILTMYRAAGSFQEPIDANIRKIQSNDLALGPGMMARIMAARTRKQQGG